MTKTLVLYFSATNTTKKMAEMVAKQLNADIAEIHPEQPYTSADLDWHDEQARTTIEQHQHGQKVAIKDDLPDISLYQNIVIGHPIWWGIPPRLINSTIDHLDLNGKNLATFVTSGGSGYGRSQSYVERSIRENGYDVKVNKGSVLNNARQASFWVASLDLQ